MARGAFGPFSFQIAFGMICGHECFWTVFLSWLLSQRWLFGWFVARDALGPCSFHSSLFGWFVARGAFGPFSFHSFVLKDGSLDGLRPGMLFDRVLLAHFLHGLWPGVPLDRSPFRA